MVRIATLLLTLLLLPLAAGARMYQWRSPDSGAVQLSGVPPGWYRSGDPGPRVRVYDNGRLIDDTAIKLPPAYSERLRAAAFSELERRQQAETARRLEVAARREELRRQRAERARARRDQAAKDGAERQATEQASQQQQQAPAAATGAPKLDDATVERLKALVADWERTGGATAP